MTAIRSLPMALTLSRFALAAAVLVAALARPAPAIFGACIAAAFLSDVFDGVIARRLGVAPIGVGIAADVEGIAISLVLPEWRHDVATIVHAWRIRRRTTHA